MYKLWEKPAVIVCLIFSFNISWCSATSGEQANMFSKGSVCLKKKCSEKQTWWWPQPQPKPESTRLLAVSSVVAQTEPVTQ